MTNTNIDVKQFKCQCVNIHDKESPPQIESDLSDVKECKICNEKETEICNDCISVKCQCKKSETRLCANCLQSVLFCLCSGKMARMDSFNSKGQGCNDKEDEFEPQFLSDNDLPHE